MNPWAFYEHKPQLIEAGLVAGVAWVALRRHRKRGGAAAVAAMASLAWASVGILDYAIYAFGYQVASLASRDIKASQLVFEWLRIPMVAVAAFSLLRGRKS